MPTTTQYKRLASSVLRYARLMQDEGNSSGHRLETLAYELRHYAESGDETMVRIYLHDIWYDTNADKDRSDVERRLAGSLRAYARRLFGCKIEDL